jgi:hypothetical protein
MRRTGIEPLPAELESLLAKERNILSEPPELRARVMARARTALRQASASPTLSPWRRRVPLLVAAALVSASATAAIAVWTESRPSPAEVPPPAPVQAPPAQQPVMAAEPAPTPKPAEIASEAADGRQRAAVPSRPAPEASAGDAYAVELGLLQRARAAVASGEFSSALAAIAEHQRRFPAGRLGEEREALRIKALVGLGRKEEARQAADRFRQRFPRSVLSTKIEETVRPEP